MKNNLPTIAFANQNRFLAVHGDKIWSQLCDNVFEDMFYVRDAVARVPYLRRFKKPQRTKYLRLVLANAAAQEEPPVRLEGQTWMWVGGSGGGDEVCPTCGL